MTHERLHAHCGSAGVPARFALAGTDRQYTRSLPFDIRHLALSLTVSLAKRSLRGSAQLDFERLATEPERLTLDAVGFDISAVELDTGSGFRKARYDYDGDTLSVRVPAKVQRGAVRVRYQAAPRRGLYFLAPDAAVPDRPEQVWSQCQDQDARHWFPCHDDPRAKMTTEVRVVVPPGFFALSNGELIQERTSERRKSWSYTYRLDQPLPSYLVTLVIGRFDTVRDRDAELPDGRRVPLTYLVPPGRASDAGRTFGQSPRMVELFSRLTGVPYPFSRYTQVVVSDFIFGGMENTTATTLYEEVMLDERAALDVSSNDLIAHELAHHWFGDHVTCRDWSHAWLNEGFATFMEHVEREDREGRDAYEYGLDSDLESYVGEATGRYARAIVCREYDVPIALFDRHLYEKGGLVLHLLRMELGDEAFWAGVRLYLQRFGGKGADTADLARSMEDAGGRSLDRFFDQWVYRPGHPVLDVKITARGDEVVVQVTQRQKTHGGAPFSLPIQIEIADQNDHITRHERQIDTAQDSLVVRCGGRPRWVGFDPSLRILGRVTVNAPRDLLQAQLAHGRTARLRYCAARALSRRDDAKTTRLLAKMLRRKHEAPAVRIECAHALGAVAGEDALSELLASRDIANARVRRAVMRALGQFRDPRAADALGQVAERDASYLVEAEAARSLGKTRQPGVDAKLAKLVDTPSWGSVKSTGVLDGLAATRTAEAEILIGERLGYGLPARVRKAAMAALGRIGEGRRSAERLADQLDDTDPLVRGAAARALGTLGAPEGRPALERRAAIESDGRARRAMQEVLRDLGTRSASEQRTSNERFARLERELRELKSQLGQLEQRSKRPRRGSKS